MRPMPAVAHAVAVLALVLAVHCPLADAKKKKFTAFPGITRHVGCDVCKEGVRHANELVKYNEKQKGLRQKEDAIQELMEQACDPRQPEGRWLRYFDFGVEEVKGKHKIVVHDIGFPGKLRRKVRSLADACSVYLLGDSDLSAHLYSKKPLKWMTDYLCVSGGDSGEVGPCHKRFKRGDIPKKLRTAVAAEVVQEASEQEMAGEQQMATMKKVPYMPEDAMTMYTRDDVEDLAIDEMMKEGMDEDEARKMYRQLKKEGFFDNAGQHLHHVTETEDPNAGKASQKQADNDDTAESDDTGDL